ncbi:MAG: glycosyltransferase family 2 protein [Acidobacteriota bacterium]
MSVLIVTWNSERWISRCLAALPAACRALSKESRTASATSVSYEVIVHDNASGDGTLRSLEARRDETLTVIDSGINSGFAAGINSAARRANGRYLFCLNPDCEPTPGSIATLVSHLEANPPVGAAVPLLVGEDGLPQRDFQLRRFPTLTSLAADVLLYEELAPRNAVSARYHCRDLNIELSQDIEQPAGAALLLRRSLFDSVGELDEGFAPAWFEDVDYCRRLGNAGENIQLVPQARVTHRGGASLDHVTFSEFQAIWYRNLFRYATKWLRASEVEALRWMIIAGMFLRIGAVLIGLSGPAGKRLDASKGYLRIARDAFKRWDQNSPSS